MIHFVDDEAMIRELLELFLEEAGYQSRGFESGEEYMDYFRSDSYEKPKVILSDVTMPGMNGYDLVLYIRQQEPLQKIILITGNPDDTQQSRVASLLCYTLGKPFRFEDLEILLTALDRCENMGKTGDPSEYSLQCECGIDHACPLHISKRLK